MSGYYQYEQRFTGFGRRMTWAVQRLMLLNIAVFAGQLLLSIPLGRALEPFPLDTVFERWLTFHPALFFQGALWQAFTYMFLHASLMHLLMNLLWLFFFGPDVERALGTRQFIWFYLVCGALGVLGTFVPTLLLGYGVSVLGASGAVMGVLVAYAMLNPDNHIFLFPFPVPITARAFVLVIIALNIFSALGEGNTSVATHLGGMAVGYAYMKVIPLMRAWHDRPPGTQEKDASQTDAPATDDIGRAVDNIFDFDQKKRKK